MVGVRYSPGAGAGFSGLVTCGSVWACPVCSAKILARRSLEIGAGLLTWEAAGGSLVMGTFTMRHHRGDSVESEWDALQRAWRSVIGSRVWSKWLSRLGSPGLVRVVEVTFGSNGWHVHLHFVLCVDGSASDELVASFGAWVTSKWTRALAAAGFPGSLDRAQDVHRVDSIRAASELGEYLAKSTAYGAADSLGRELMGQWSKDVRSVHSTVPAWWLAEQFGEDGEVELLDLWLEYERASKGRRQCTWTQGLRDVLGIGVESTDEEIAGEVVGDRDLVWITAAGWEAAWRSHLPTCNILQAVEAGGDAGLRAYLDQNGIEYTEVVSSGEAH